MMTSRQKIRQFIIDFFSDDELEDLTFDYFPDVSRLYTSRMAKGQKVRELIDFADRRGRTDHLMAALEKVRPEAFCEFFDTEIEALPSPIVGKRNPRQIFLSYANPDAEVTYRLAGDLRAAGYTVWMAPDSIQPGEKWVDAVNRGLMESGIFLLVLTPEAVSSKWVYDETSVAIALENKNQMRFYVLKVESTDAPPLWSIRQYISFEQDYEAGLNKLLTTLSPSSTQGKTAILRPPTPEFLGTDAAVIPADRPVLVIDWPDGKQQAFSLDKSLTRIGRASVSDLLLNFPTVSNAHLLVQTEVRQGSYYIHVTDLGSTNGTYHNGRKLQSNSACPLESKDVIHLGDPAGSSLKLTVKVPLLGAVGTIAGSAVRDQPARFVEAQGSPAVSSKPANATRDLEPAVKPAGAGGKRSVWMAVVGLLVLLGITIGAFTWLADQRQDADTADSGAATIHVQLPTDVATEPAVAAVDPTRTVALTTTDEPATPLAIKLATNPTIEPTIEPTLTSPTPTAKATDRPATAVPTPTATAPPVVLNRITLDPDTSLEFETFGLWTLGDQENGTLTQSRVEVHSGAYSARLDYDFPNASNDFVVFLQEHDIAGTPNALQIWVYGDGSGHFLNAWIIDAGGQTWQTPFGQISHNGWRQMTAYIDTEQGWPWTHISGPNNGEVDYPIKLRGLVLDDRSADFIGQGTVYLDDLTAALLDQTQTVGSTVPSQSAVGTLFFTSGNSIYTTDPAWSTAQLLGTAESNTCGSETRIVGGNAYTLDPAPFCNIGGGTAVCSSPDGRYQVLVGITPLGRSILVRMTDTEGGNFIFEGPVSESEGILWSPTSASFLFVAGNTVYRAFPDGGSQTVAESAYSPQFSPDGRLVAFVRASGSRDIFVWSEGAEAKNVSNLGLADAICPKWAAGS